MSIRVLLVVQQLRRTVAAGIGTYSRGLLDGLRSLDHPPDITLHASRPAARPDPLASYGFRVEASPLPGPLLTRAWDQGLAGPPPGFDVMHSTSLAMPPVRKGTGAVTVHDLFWREIPEAFPPRGRRWHEAAYHRALDTCRLVVVPSLSVATAVANDAPSGMRVEVVPEGCDHLAPADHEGADQALTRLGINGPFLLTVSTLEPRKNLPRLVAAYQQARRQLDDPPQLLVVGFRGWGPEEASAARGDGVVVAGEVSDPVLTSLLERALAVAFVPLREGFGLPAVEAMAAGAPVVASPMPSTADAALEVDPLDEQSITAALVAVVNDGSLRADLVAAGARRAAQLTWETAARSHVELWQSLL